MKLSGYDDRMMTKDQPDQSGYADMHNLCCAISHCVPSVKISGRTMQRDSSAPPCPPCQPLLVESLMGLK